MNDKDIQYLTAQGLKEVKTELQQLKEVKRQEILDKLSNARDKGDLSENAEYTTAKEDLNFTDNRIEELEDIIKFAKIIKTTKKGCKKVVLGTKVTVKVKTRKLTFTVVGEWEANPSENKISHESPLGKALMNQKEGDVVEIEAPSGNLSYKLIKIH